MATSTGAPALASTSSVSVSAASPQVAPPPPVTTARPGEAHGIIVRDEPGAGWRWGPRVALFIPRWTLQLALWSVEGVLYVFDRFELKELFEKIFFDETGTYGAFPTALIETGFGLNVGVRGVHRDLFGGKERLNLAVGFGGLYRQRYAMDLNSGRRFGRDRQFQLRAKYETRPEQRFFGIGRNRTLQSGPRADGLVDPYDRDWATETQLRRSEGSVSLRWLEKFSEDLSFGATVAWEINRFDPPTEGDLPYIFDVYDPDALIYVFENFNTFYAEIDATYDDRKPATRFLGPATPSSGWRINAFFGYTRTFARPDDKSYGRVGLDIIRHFDLYHGDRILTLRLYFESVSGPLQDVPLFELPQLGGPVLLRGYLRDRFRDRALTLLSAEYQFPITPGLVGYLFVDGGEVWNSVDDISPLDMGIGFGGGLQFQTARDVIGRFQFASSRDGDVFVALVFDATFDLRPRTER